MVDYLRRFGQWGMVAGAAEGIGAAFCGELARTGMNVIMADVNAKGLESLAIKLERDYHIETHRLTINLAEQNAPERCMEIIKETGCRLLIYNAAYSRVKPFLSAGPEELDLYINVNTRTPLRLVHLFATELKLGENNGGILLMSSLAGLWGTQLVATYSGTKGFNLLLAEALSHELKPFKIEVSACCAGATATPGYLGTKPKSGFGSPPVMDPARVASIALKSIGKKTVILPGLTNKFTYFLLTRILPRSLSAALVNRTMRNTYRKDRG